MHTKMSCYSLVVCVSCGFGPSFFCDICDHLTQGRESRFLNRNCILLFMSVSLSVFCVSLPHGAIGLAVS